MNSSSEINELMAALSAAQGEMVGATKDAINPHFRSQYSDLASVIAAIKEPLAKHGLCHIQGTGQLIDGCVQVSTRIGHKSGQWIESTAAIPIGAKITSQTYGSACTYGRRYGLMALAGVPSIDDDGNEASAAPSAPVAPSQPADGLIDGNEATSITDALSGSGVDVGKFLAYFKISTLGEMRKSQLPKALALIAKKRAEQE